MSNYKLWQKGTPLTSDLSLKVEAFTAGKDRALDILLAPYDVLGSIAHVKMLQSVGLISDQELQQLQQELVSIFKIIMEGNFSIRDGAEDIHSEVEFRLTEALGETGKKVHSGRSRNDQVLVDLKLFTRQELLDIVHLVFKLFETLQQKSEEYKDILLPGYTHLQVAMVSSFGQWLGAYAESLVDDVNLLYAAFGLANKNPLGSGAGYGGSLPLNRKLTTTLLGFDDLNYNAIYAQMNRGKMEKVVATALASLAATLSRLSMDATLFMSQNFGYISFPEQLTTGSSIMPHKKNPDVWELIRARCNKIQTIPTQMAFIQNNLPSGYHRDMQVLKEDYLPMFADIKDCLEMTGLMIQHISVRDNITEDKKYLYIFTVERVNELVLKGIPFRDAYRQVGEEVESGQFKKPDTTHHTHEGSIGNLCTQEIRQMMEKAIALFPKGKIEKALAELI